MTDLDIPIPGDISTIGIPLYEQCRMAFLLRYRNVHTRVGYDRSLTAWFAFCEEITMDPLRVKRVHIEAWARVLEEKVGNRLSTVASKLNALAGYYRYAVAEEIIDRDPMVNVDRPKVPRESSNLGITRFELVACIKEAKKDGPRTYAMHCLLGLNGFRISELLGIDIGNLGREGPYHTVRIWRKGGKWETQPLGYTALEAVHALVGDRTSGPLFATRNGLRLTRPAAHRIIVRIAKAAGVPHKVSPHSYRHGFVTAARNANIPSRDIIAATGHADERMLVYYDREKVNLARSAVHGVEAFIAGVS